MDHNEAIAAVEAAFAADAAPTKPVEASTPPAEVSAPSQAMPTPAAPEATAPMSEAEVAEGAQELASMDEESFSRVDPATLPEELQTIYRSMQADYTRKTQALAEQRKQFEQFGGDLASLQEAAALRARLADPNEWVNLYNELQGALTEYNLLDAGDDFSGMPADPGVQMPDLGAIDDPDLAPFQSAFQALQGQVEQLQSQLEYQRQAEQAEQQYNAILGELQRQENAILQSNPHYTDTDLNAIADLAAAFGGDLFQAQSRYEEIISSRLAGYLSQKAPAPQGNESIGQIIPAASSEAGEVTLDSAHAAAQEALRQMEGRGL